MLRNKDKKPKDRPNLYLLHVPKTAGTTVSHYLRGYYTVKDTMPYSAWNQLLSSLKKRQLKSKKSQACLTTMLSMTFAIVSHLSII